MSIHPTSLLAALHDCAAGKLTLHLTAGYVAGEAAWLLTQLKHKDDRIEALGKLVKPDATMASLPATVAPTPSIMDEPSVCLEADRLVSGSRQADYGHPVFDFTRTARIWEVILDRPAGEITPEQVGLCQIGVKIGRHLHKPKTDNLVDICGYARTVQMCDQYRRETTLG